MYTAEDEKFMRLAIELAESNVKQMTGGPFGAIIVKDGQIISASANQVIKSNDPTAHAEIAAIRLACENLGTIDLQGCTIYSSCEPCPMCLGAIYWARIGTLYFGNTKADAAAAGFDDDHIYQEMAKPAAARSLKRIQILADEAAIAFKLWQGSDSKFDY